MSAMSITYKPSLREANTLKRALECYRDEQIKRINLAGGPDRLPGTTQEVGIVETMLARDFGWKLVNPTRPFSDSPASDQNHAER